MATANLLYLCLALAISITSFAQPGPTLSMTGIGLSVPGSANPGMRGATSLVLNGTVVVDDGTPLSEPAVIQVNCNGHVHTQGSTDSNGHFSFELSTGGHFVESNASESGSSVQSWSGSTALAWTNCEVYAELSGFTSQQIALSGAPLDSHVADIGRIVLHRLVRAQGYMISATSAAAPEKARKDFEGGQKEERQGRWSSALEKFKRAVGRYPKYALAWLELGRVQLQQGNADAARQSFHEALTADSKMVAPYSELAQVALREKQWQELADTTDQLLRLDPADFPQYWFFNAVANYYLGKFDAAEKAVLQGLRLDVQHRIPRMHYLLGVILAHKKDYQGAAEHVRGYLELAPSNTDAAFVRQQLNELERLAAAGSLRKTGN